MVDVRPAHHGIPGSGDRSTMPTALGYGRKSFVRRGSDVDAVSVDKQRIAVERRAAERADQLVWFEDAQGHRSGRYERTRPGYLQLLTRLQDDSTVSAVIFYELDRAARSVITIDKIIKICQARAIAFICIKEGIDSTRGMGADETFKIQLLASLAEREANKTSERMSEIATYYREELHIQWGMWPFGYARHGEGRNARFVPTQYAETIMRLFALYIAGNGYTETANELNKLGYVHVGRRGQVKAFTREAIRSIVGNVLFYAGYLGTSKQHAKQSQPALDGTGSYLERYARTMHAERSTAITPIIDEATADAVIERRAKNEWTGRKSQTWTALLTPIAYWGKHKLRAQSIYTGNWYRARGMSFDGDKIEAELISRLRAIRFPDDVREFVRSQFVAMVGDERRRELQAQEAEIAVEFDLLYDLLKTKRIQRTTYDQRFITAERQLHEIRRKMAAPTDADILMQAFSDLARAIDIMTPRKRKMAIQHLVERVDIADDGEIKHLELRESIRATFLGMAQILQTVPPVSSEHNDSKAAPDPIGWLIEKVA